MNTFEILLPNGAVPTSDDTVLLNIGIGVVPDLRVKVMLGDLRDGGLPIVHLTLRFHFTEARYVAEFVGLEDNDVSSVDLRAIRVAELVRVGAAGGIFIKTSENDPPLSLREHFGYEGEASWPDQQDAGKGPTDATLRKVALSYQLAQISSQPPAKAVERQFALPSRTAARWIARAKTRGFIERPAVPGYEDLTEMNDRMREKIARGEMLVHELGPEDLREMQGED